MRVLTHARPRRRHAQLRSSVRVLRTSARRARPHHTSDDRMSLEPRFGRAQPSISSGNRRLPQWLRAFDSRQQT
jgi:hypothetical protein